ncbi:hypothetical protein JAAARDRAFT_31016 [Jaapia argillacea MUCL 33604]|uniref:Uncharacterized protein n=1 Tax=Jaapia argillacea MUCL 33604 TaxID=933084 RepID=A0A067Q3B7_9AGAM|nr:hypothetical protein JAAARDRAFT_31016 [Jaapia argillacea MUCL 33604]
MSPNRWAATPNCSNDSPSHSSQWNEPASKLQRPKPSHQSTFQTESASASRTLVEVAPSQVTHETLQTDAATYHLREIGAHTRALIGEASRGIASLLSATFERVIQTVSSLEDDREIDSSRGAVEPRTVNDDNLLPGSPRSSVTAISWPPSPFLPYSNVEHDPTSLDHAHVSTNTNIAHIEGSSQSLGHCVTCRRSFDETSSVPSISSGSSDGMRRREDRSVNTAAPLTSPFPGASSHPRLHTISRITNIPDRPTPFYNFSPVDMTTASPRQDPFNFQSSVLPPPDPRIIPHATRQYHSVGRPSFTPSRIPIAIHHRRPSTTEHPRSEATPRHPSTNSVDWRPPGDSQARGMRNTNVCHYFHYPSTLSNADSSGPTASTPLPDRLGDPSAISRSIPL